MSEIPSDIILTYRRETKNRRCFFEDFMLYITTRNKTHYTQERKAMEDRSYTTEPARLESANFDWLVFLFKDNPAGKKLLSIVGVGEKILKQVGFCSMNWAKDKFFKPAWRTSFSAWFEGERSEAAITQRPRCFRRGLREQEGA